MIQKGLKMGWMLRLGYRLFMKLFLLFVKLNVCSFWGIPCIHPFENFVIELAVAGFGKKEISISKEKEVLIIKGEQEKEESKEFVHQGLSSRNFTRRFTLADDIVVNGADMKDGILKVSLERVVPEEDKPQEIKIS